MNQNFAELIEQAQQLTGRRELTSDMSVGKVACVVRSKSGKIYTGLSIKATSGMGFCAEIAAMSRMITDGETEIEMLVATNENGRVITPCGKCREFLFQLSRANLQTRIILSETESVTLEELLPKRWQEYWGDRE